MKRDELSLRQMMVLLSVSLLGPATGLLPYLTAQRAGSGGALAVVAALPLLLAALWAAGRICRRWGRVPGTLLTIIYMVWTLLTLTLAVSLCSARLARNSGQMVSLVGPLLLLALATWMGWGKLSALARAAEIFYLVLAVVLAGVLLLAAFRVEWSNLSLSGQELAAVPGSSLTIAGLLLNVYPAVVLGSRVAPTPRGGHRAVGWVVAFCVAAALLTAAILGCLGPGLTARLQAPFFLMIQGLGVKGAFQRTEALVTALWTLSDLTLFGLLLHTWRALAASLHPGKWARRSVPAVALAAIAAAAAIGLLPGMAESVGRSALAVMPAVGLILGLICPLIFSFFAGRKGGG